MVPLHHCIVGFKLGVTKMFLDLLISIQMVRAAEVCYLIALMLYNIFPEAKCEGFTYLVTWL